MNVEELIAKLSKLTGVRLRLQLRNGRLPYRVVGDGVLIRAAQQEELRRTLWHCYRIAALTAGKEV